MEERGLYGHYHYYGPRSRFDSSEGKRIAYSKWVQARFDCRDHRLVREMEPAPPSSVWQRLERCYRLKVLPILQKCLKTLETGDGDKSSASFWRLVDETHPPTSDTAKYTCSCLAKSLFRLEDPDLSLEVIRDVIQRHHDLTTEVLSQ